VAGFLIRPAWGFLMIAVVLLAWILLTRAFDLGYSRERGDEAVLRTVGQRPLPGDVLRASTDDAEEE
jgi:hypothetical protein